MESNINTSKISILFGEEPQGNEQIAVHLKALLGSVEAQKQKQELQLLGLPPSELDYSVVIVFKPVSEHHESLQEHLKSILDGQTGSKMSSDLGAATTSGILSYNLSSNQDKIYLLLKPGQLYLGEVENQINGFKALGLAAILEGQENKVLLDITSTQSFVDIEGLFKSGKYTFIAALLRTLKLDLNLILATTLIPAAVDILSNLDANIANSPIGFLSFFKNLDLDLKFSSVDELPDYFKNSLLKHPDLADGLSVSPNLPENDQKSFKKLASSIANGIEVFVTVKDVAALNLQVSGAGFGQHLVSRISKD